MVKKETRLKILHFSLEKTVRLLPQQSKWVSAMLDVPDATGESQLVGVVLSKIDTLAGVTCDFILNNWGSESICVTKGTVVGQVEGAEGRSILERTKMYGPSS